MKIVWIQKVTRGRIGALLFQKSADVVQGLNVENDHPVLRSVMTLMDAKQQAHIEAGSVAGMPPDEAKAELRCVACLQEMQEIILEEAEKARKANA